MVNECTSFSVRSRGSKEREKDIYYQRFERWNLSPGFIKEYVIGTRVWIPHSQNVWQEAKVVENFVKDVLKVSSEDGQIKELPIAKDENLPPLRNPDILIGENDLTALSYLHEPAVLHNLQVRFCRQNAIYTYCGIVLVAINPYTELPIYGPDTLWTYRGQTMGDLDPHIFAVAEEAYTKMEREQTDQSIIVSGESGAGKTVSAKYAMRYFAMVGGSVTETHVEKKVLASSPIMEAIGNAKTIRNDNSSRFGKYIELHCSKTYNIVGASMRTYLLEKSRVVNQAPGERNYHVFYQLCAARDKYKSLYLDEPDNFFYLSQESNITGVDDLKAFDETISAMITLGFTSQDIDDMCVLLASVLHLGNINIRELDNNSEFSNIKPEDKHLKILTNLLQLDGQQLSKWLCQRQLTSLRETIIKPMTVSEAQFARDALSKHIYAQLFHWIVDKINRGLKTANDSKHKFIGVLDIYGFETFEVNSFEQFCINYANEKLQQQFNMHVFKLEQDEYLKEGIEWKFIDFYDNQPCIDLIESKLGILDLLDEECRMPRGSDSSWAQKLYEKCTKWPHFTKPRFGVNSFVIKHFADKVDYEVGGFLEKNRDTVIEEQVDVLRNCQNRLMLRIFQPEEEENKLSVPKGPSPKVRISAAAAKPASPSPSASSRNRKTVGSQFRDSLNALMSSLNATTPHYIRCIKPNDDKSSFRFHHGRVVQQLRACGVLETIRISAAGFPSRWLYGDFLKRYRALSNSRNIDRRDVEGTCQKLIKLVLKQEDKYKFGKTKIFFRSGQVAYMERLRSERLLQCCIRIQTCVRGFLVRRRYTRTLRATNTLQRYVRGFLARRRAEGIRRNNAATVIQKHFKRWKQHTIYIKLKKSALGIQKYGRGYLARRKYMEMRYNHAAIIIQKTVRGWLCRMRYKKTRKQIILAQSAVRRHIARKMYKKLKIEARSAEHLKKLNKGLENKIISLQQKIEDLMKENGLLKCYAVELSDTKSKLEAYKGMEIKLKTAHKDLKNRENEVEKLHEDMMNLKNILSQREKQEKETSSEREILRKETKLASDKILLLQEELQSAKYGFEEELKQRLNEERRRVQDEFGQERVSHQKLLAEREVLESRIENLELELSGRGGRWAHRRAPSDASTVSADADAGYSSVPSSAAQRTDSPPESHPPNLDLSLVVRLQQKLKFLDNDNRRLYNKIEADKALQNSGRQFMDDYKVQEHEIENSKLRSELVALRECIARDSASSGDLTLQELVSHLESRECEVERLREENVMLRSSFNNKLQSAKALAQSSYSSCKDIDTSVINEDGELVLAFEAQKKILRQLEDELQNKMMSCEVEREELAGELDKVRRENEKLQGLMAAGLPHAGLHSQSDAYLEYEVARITSDYLELQEKYNNKSAKCRKLQEQNWDLVRRLKDAGIIDPDSSSSILITDKLSPERLPAVKKKEREYTGMFEYKSDDATVLIRHLLELKPPIAITLLPGLPAYILFKCIRYTDYINNVPALQKLVLHYDKSLSKLLRNKSEDLDLSVLWLSNTLRLLNCLKQYSGEKHFAGDNTQTQNEQCLKNFDLAEFRQLLSDRALSIFQDIVKTVEERLHPLSVPAILEHEAISGLTTAKGMARSASVTSTTISSKKVLDQLLGQLTTFNRMLNLHGVDQQLILQFFKQIFYFLCAHSLNNLLLRKEYCNWSKGMQIRYNLSHLEQWVRERKLQEGKIVDMLAPIVQAAQLLQARKSDSDVEPVAEMCKNLTINQIVKLLNLYTPIDGYEYESGLPKFIDEIQKLLTEQRKTTDETLLMDTKYMFPVEFPFSPSNIRLEDIEIPQILNLPMLRKI